jgi:hypothetical protein
VSVKLAISCRVIIAATDSAVARCRLIARLPDAKRQAEEYAAAGMFQEAAETAAQNRDGDMLSKIQGMVGATSPLGLAVSKIGQSLQLPMNR